MEEGRGEACNFTASLISGWSQGRESSSVSPPCQALLRVSGGRRRRKARRRWEEKGNQRHSSPGAGRRVCGAGLGLLPPGALQRPSRSAPRRAAAALQHRGQREEDEAGRGCFRTADSSRAPPLGGQRSAFQHHEERSEPRTAPQKPRSAAEAAALQRPAAPRLRSPQPRGCPPRRDPARTDGGRNSCGLYGVPRKLRMRRGRN